MLWDGLLQIVGYIVILYVYIGWSTFIGVIVMIVSLPTQLRIMKATQRMYLQWGPNPRLASPSSSVA